MTRAHLTVAALITCGVAGASSPAQAAVDDSARQAMVANIRREIETLDPAADNQALRDTLRAMARIPREPFVSRSQRALAYREQPLPIGFGQTISDPYIVAVMTAALQLKPAANVLDIGTGSGYQAAVLGLMADRVWSMEIVDSLARSAAARLKRLRCANVTIRAGDGYSGWPEHAPFDAIVVAAGAADVPKSLLDQLKIGGRIVMPIGPSWASEQLLVITKTGPSTNKRCSLGMTIFVPITGTGARGHNAAGVMADIPLCYANPIARPDFVPVSPISLRR